MQAVVVAGTPVVANADSVRAPLVAAGLQVADDLDLEASAGVLSVATGHGRTSCVAIAHEPELRLRHDRPAESGRELLAGAGGDGEAFVVVEDGGDLQAAAECFDVAAEGGQLHLAAAFDA